MLRMPAWPLAALLVLALAACSSAPSQRKPVNPITRLPPQTKPVPPPDKMPAFGSDEFNRIKDAHPENPPDVSQVPEPEPVDEPRSRYGNKSPYTVLGETYRVLPTAKGYTATGKASWYGKKFHGLRTSSGEKYDMYKMTAAHRSLPLPSYVRVTNLANGKSVVVKVNDRGPFHSERIMDLSYAAAARLDILKSGTGKVRIEAIDPAERRAAQQQESGTRTAATLAPAPAAPPAVPIKSFSSDAAAAAARFFVQVGAFSEPANAAGLQSKVVELVYAPVTIASEGDATPINRVQIGPFPTREDADKVSQIIRDNNLGTPIVVTR
ncbi:MAG: lipoprotein [Moraxellaceae bacterium]|jgi:rare lipoprotein A|nr:lipoprotein [Moraxellaceae bacterium]